MTQSLTDWLQHNRLVVVSVDPSRHALRLKGVADVCTDLSCSERTVVITDEDTAGALASLNAGDIVTVDGNGPGGLERIVVVRRVWEELTSPEF
jgi:hypothetical protein